MPFSWVRHIRQRGAWGTETVSLELTASPLAATGYGLVVVAIAVLLGWPLAIAGTALASEGAEASTALGLSGLFKLATVTALTLAGLIWFAYCAYRSAMARAEVTISDRMVTVTEPRLFGTRQTRTPLSSFDGLAILPRTTLSERSNGLFLLHPDRRLSPLLVAASMIDPQETQHISAALGVPLVASVDPAASAVVGSDQAPRLQQQHAA